MYSEGTSGDCLKRRKGQFRFGGCCVRGRTFRKQRIVTCEKGEKEEKGHTS